ncbi:MAG TPA: undecaprenyl-diphosphate phosphatase [Candidatus Paceibacterota bacterium]|nr:undecaprenyl-diphosphate phosphatase [Candidatus Paceibacterota bacterium]
MVTLHALILGIVEGITEFLPISSTGHLLLAGELLKIPATEFQKSFDIIIQLGAILSVVAIYWHKLWNIAVIKKLVVAFIPTGIIGLTLYKVIKGYLLGNHYVVLAALLIGGIALIAFELWHKEPEGATVDIESISYKQAFSIGLFQTLAIVPGVSRSAATVVGGLLLGLKRTTIVEFSFLLAVPTMLAATGLDLLKNASAFSSNQFGTLAIGFVTSFVVAYFSIKFLLSYIQKHTFISFGVYRIVAAILFWFIIL